MTMQNSDSDVKDPSTLTASQALFHWKMAIQRTAPEHRSETARSILALLEDGSPSSYLRSYYQAGDAEVIEWIREVRILSAE